MLIFPRDKPRKIILIPAEMPFSWFKKFFGRLEGRYYIKLDGIEDGKFFNEAFQSLPRNPGGWVYSAAGQANIGTTIYQPNFSKFSGAGHSSILQATGGLNIMWSNGVPLDGSQDLEVCDLAFKGQGAPTGWAMVLNADGAHYNDRAKIHDCYFKDILNGAQAIVATNCRDIDISHNIFENVFAGPTVGAKAGRIVLAFNKVIDPHDAGLAVLWGLATSPSITSIVGNVIEGSGTGGEIDVVGSTDLTAVGNVVRNSAQDGMSIFKFLASPLCYRATITGNVFEGCDRFGLHIEAEHFSIAGNTIMNNGWCGVWVDQDSKHGVIGANAIIDNGQDVGAAYPKAAIRLVWASHITIAGNDLSDTQGAPTQDWGIYHEAGSDITVGSNEIQGNITGPVYSAVAGEPKERTGNLGYPDPAARVFHSANQNIPNNAWTVLDFDSESYDTDGIHDLVLNIDRLTCRTAGKYRISTNIEWAANAAGIRVVALILNGVTGLGEVRNNPVAAGVTGQAVPATYDLTVGDFVYVQVYQNSGGALNVTGGVAHSPLFTMERITG